MPCAHTRSRQVDLPFTNINRISDIWICICIKLHKTTKTLANALNFNSGGSWAGLQL